VLHRPKKLGIKKTHKTKQKTTTYLQTVGEPTKNQSAIKLSQIYRRIDLHTFVSRHQFYMQELSTAYDSFPDQERVTKKTKLMAQGIIPFSF
jgi:hypothetical protein